MSDIMDCESLLLDDDDAVDKYSEGSVGDDIGNVDEDALLADGDDTDFISSKYHIRSRIKFDKSAQNEINLGTPDVDLGDAAIHKKNSGVMAVSSTTLTEPEPNISLEHDDEEERETRFKQERQITTTNRKYSNIPDSLDDVVINDTYNHRNQKPFRGRGRGYFNSNHQRNKPEGKTVLINPHFRGKVTVTNNNNRPNWDARQKINHNYRQQTQHMHQPFIQQNHNQVIEPWNNNVQIQQPPPPQFQPFAQQIPQQQIYNQPPGVPVQHSQVPQQILPQYQPPQQCFIQPLQEPFFSPPSQFTHPSQFNHPPPQFQPPVPHFPSDQSQFGQPNPLRMVPYNNSQFVMPQNQLVQPLEPYGQPIFNPPVQHPNPYHNQIPPNHQNRYVEANKHFYQNNINKRKPINSGAIRKNKKRNQVVSKNLQEVRTVQIPDTTVKDDEDDATKEYRKLIEQQKRKREEILQQKEARRRQAAQLEENTLGSSIPKQMKEHVVPVQTQTKPLVVPNPMVVPNRVVQNQQPIQLLVPSHNIFNTPVRKVTPMVVNQTNPNIKVVNIVNEPNLEKQHLSSFLTNRKILAKDESLLDTNIVLISNLADGTTAIKLRKMCIGIGDVKNLQMSPKERQATIQFNSVASAHAFFKKYQRTMLDLSVIQVTLKAMS